MRDIINQKIKFRERFRPFAPSVLAEAIDDYFVGAVHDPFMIQVYPVRPDKRDVIPAVTHVDGSGRLQTVSRDSNPALLGADSRVRAQTGVPVLLNTSFNENEPIVERPEQALDCFLRTDMDVLVMGPHVLSKPAMTGAGGAPLRVCYFNRSLLAGHRRHRPAADRAGGGPGREHGMDVTVVTGYPRPSSRRRGRCRIRDAQRRAHPARAGHDVVAAIVRRPGGQLPDLFPVGAVDRRCACRGRT